MLEHVVQTNDKQRFTINETSPRIRANRGHSVDVDLAYELADPPAILLRGTPLSESRRFVKAVFKKMSRRRVHLHCDSRTALAVGTRRGTPGLLKVRAYQMVLEEFVFFVTVNAVWLT